MSGLGLGRGAVLLVLWASLLAPAAGCATSIHVRHEDPRNPVALIWLDGKQAGTVAYGKTISMDVNRGPHRLRAVLPGGTDRTPWHPEEPELDVVIDEDATFTLLPRDSR